MGGKVAVAVVRLGSERLPHEGLRIGTVRRPPRGVRKTDYARGNYYDVWLPLLAPSAASVKQAQGARSQTDWNRFVKRYRKEMNGTRESQTIELLAALSHRVDFSVGCYCADESRCHRSVLRELLRERRARLR